MLYDAMTIDTSELLLLVKCLYLLRYRGNSPAGLDPFEECTGDTLATTLGPQCAHSRHVRVVPGRGDQGRPQLCHRGVAVVVMCRCSPSKSPCGRCVGHRAGNTRCNHLDVRDCDPGQSESDAGTSSNLHDPPERLDRVPGRTDSVRGGSLASAQRSVLEPSPPSSLELEVRLVLEIELKTKQSLAEFESCQGVRPGTAPDFSSDCSSTIVHKPSYRAVREVDCQD
jgi:hypothetical protein